MTGSIKSRGDSFPLKTSGFIIRAVKVGCLFVSKSGLERDCGFDSIAVKEFGIETAPPATEVLIVVAGNL